LATEEAASKAASRAREGWGWVIEEPEEAGSWVRMRRAEAPTARRGAGGGGDGGQESRGDAVGLGEELNEQVRRLDLGIAGRGGGLHGPGDRLLRLRGVVRIHTDLL